MTNPWVEHLPRHEKRHILQAKEDFSWFGSLIVTLTPLILFWYISVLQFIRSTITSTVTCSCYSPRTSILMTNWAWGNLSGKKAFSARFIAPFFPCSWVPLLLSLLCIKPAQLHIYTVRGFSAIYIHEEGEKWFHTCCWVCLCF